MADGEAMAAARSMPGQGCDCGYRTVAGLTRVRRGCCPIRARRRLLILYQIMFGHQMIIRT